MATLIEEIINHETSQKSSLVRARILWPALGFPAIIAPKERNSPAIDPTRCICILLLSDQKCLSKKQAAQYLRYVPWGNRSRRHIQAGGVGAFDEGDINIHNDIPCPSGKDSRLTLPIKDRYAQIIQFGDRNENGDKSITVSLSNYVREFYINLGLQYLHEIQIYERACNKLKNGLYHLFWNNYNNNEKAPSDEMRLLLNNFAEPRWKNSTRQILATISQTSEERRKLAGEFSSYLRSEYEYEYKCVHEPYKSKNSRSLTRIDVLHPVFVQRSANKSAVKIGHLTDMHVDVRADLYDANLSKAEAEAKSKINFLGTAINYNNWNRSFEKVYESARENSDMLLFTGDLIDYSRGHIGLPYSDHLKHDNYYHVDRNWFLFYDLLAAGGQYKKPVYTILGNHDWRLNPYPPEAIAGIPNPRSLFHNTDVPSEILKRILRTAHGDGWELKFSYSSQAKSISDLFKINPIKAIGEYFRLDSNLVSTMDKKGFPTETTIDSVAWYLMIINPFFDYSFTLPGGQKSLMLDWAEDEDLFFPIIEGGRARSWNVAQKGDLDKASTPGPKAKNCPTELQMKMISAFVKERGKAKFIGIHTPLIGPYPSWSDEDIRFGIKKYQSGEKPPPTHRGSMGMFEIHSQEFTEDMEMEIARGPWPHHALYAISPTDGPHGMEADFGSLSNKENRTWFIKELAKNNSGVRLVFSGHIHRNGLYIAYQEGAAPTPKQMRLIGIDSNSVQGVPYPGVAKTPQSKQWPLYVNTTSAGPRGHYYPKGNEDNYINPGYSIVELRNDGIIVSAIQYPLHQPKRPSAPPTQKNTQSSYVPRLGGHPHLPPQQETDSTVLDVILAKSGLLAAILGL